MPLNQSQREIVLSFNDEINIKYEEMGLPQEYSYRNHITASCQKGLFHINYSMHELQNAINAIYKTSLTFSKRRHKVLSRKQYQ